MMQPPVRRISQRLACFRAVVRLQARPALERAADPADRAYARQRWLGKGVKHLGLVCFHELNRLAHLEGFDGARRPFFSWELHDVLA